MRHGIRRRSQLPKSLLLRAKVLIEFAAVHMSLIGRLCCKSPKLPGDDFLAVRRSDRRTPVCAASITLPRSPVSLSVGDEVPHIFTRRSRLKP
jgi:hypothetical protein